jgi:hypothetical protein
MKIEKQGIIISMKNAVIFWRGSGPKGGFYEIQSDCGATKSTGGGGRENSQIR